MDLLELQDRNILHKAWTEVIYSYEMILELVGLFSNYSINQSFHKSNNIMSSKLYIKFDRE